jgi:hypothetical protein
MHWEGVSEEKLATLGLPSSGGPNRQLCRRTIMANLVCADRSHSWLSYSRDRSAYSGRRRYDGPAGTYTHVRAVADELDQRGLIQHDRAWPGRLGLRSRMKANTALQHALASVGTLEYRPREVIHLKDGAGRLAGYCDNVFTRRIRREVCKLNEAFRSIKIALVSPDVAWLPIAVRVDNAVLHPPKVACYRIFNGGWCLGGRLYGPFWQNLSKHRRLQLTLDGAAVVEHDFAQLHPRLLYAEFGYQLGKDAYTVRGYESDRPAVKQAWQILINAASRRQAVLALATELGGFHRQDEASRLLESLEQHHQAVSSAFYTRAGLRLQRRDSDLIVGIMQQCLSEGIVALPVHDSLIVAEGRTVERTHEIMQDHLTRLLASVIEKTKEGQK